MVSRKTALSRFAFTMIELIFAIVVISIAVMSLPMMAQMTSKGIEDNIVQEAIFAASAELMGATSYYWDGNSIHDINTSHLERVIDIANDCNATTNLRPGHINQLYHRRCLDDNALDALDAGANTLNAAAHGNEVIFLDTSGGGVIKSAAGYKEEYESNLTVTRAANIKTITVTVTDSATPPKTITVLRAQSANIGEIDFYKRRF